MQVKAVPIENYNLDTSDPTDRWVNNVDKTLKNITQKPRNSVNNVSMRNSQIIGLEEGIDYGSGYIVTPAPPLPYTGNIFNIFSAEYNKLANIASYNLGVGMEIMPLDIPGSNADYSVNLYLNIFKYDPGKNPSGSEFDPLLVYPLGAMNWTNALGYQWATSNPSRFFDLRDTILYRDVQNFIPDFANNTLYNSNSKITQAQYADLLSDFTSNIYASVCYTGISGATKTHFDTNWGASASGYGSYAMALTIDFNPIGSLANFEPI